MHGPRAWTAVILAEVHFPGARTLKDRRSVLRSILDRLKGAGFSTAQVGPADLPGRAWIAASGCAGSESAARSMAAAADAVLEDPRAEVAGRWTEIVLHDPEVTG